MKSKSFDASLNSYCCQTIHLTSVAHESQQGAEHFMADLHRSHLSVAFCEFVRTYRGPLSRASSLLFEVRSDRKTARWAKPSGRCNRSMSARTGRKAGGFGDPFTC